MNKVFLTAVLFCVVVVIDTSIKSDVETLMNHRNGKESSVSKRGHKEATCFKFGNRKLCYCPAGYRWFLESRICENIDIDQILETDLQNTYRLNVAKTTYMPEVITSINRINEPITTQSNDNVISHDITNETESDVAIINTDLSTIPTVVVTKMSFEKEAEAYPVPIEILQKPPTEDPLITTAIVQEASRSQANKLSSTTEMFIPTVGTETITTATKKIQQKPATETKLTTSAVVTVPEIGESLATPANKGVSTTVSPAQEATTGYSEELSVTTASTEADIIDSAVVLSETSKTPTTAIIETATSRKAIVNDSSDIFLTTVSYIERENTVNVVEGLSGTTEALKTENVVAIPEMGEILTTPANEGLSTTVSPAQEATTGYSEELSVATILKEAELSGTTEAPKTENVHTVGEHHCVMGYKNDASGKCLDFEPLMKHPYGKEATCFFFGDIKMCYCPTGYKWNMESMLCQSLDVDEIHEAKLQTTDLPGVTESNSAAQTTNIPDTTTEQAFINNINELATTQLTANDISHEIASETPGSETDTKPKFITNEPFYTAVVIPPFTDNEIINTDFTATKSTSIAAVRTTSSETKSEASPAPTKNLRTPAAEAPHITAATTEEAIESLTTLPNEEFSTTSKIVPTEAVTIASSVKEFELPISTEKPENLATVTLIATEVDVEEISESTATLENKEASATAKPVPIEAATSLSSEKKSEHPALTDKQKHPDTESLIPTEPAVQEITESLTTLTNKEIPTTVKHAHTIDTEPLTTGSPYKEPEIPTSKEKQQKSATTVSIVKETNESQTISALKEISTTARPVPTEVVTTSSSEKELEPSVSMKNTESLATEAPIATDAVVQEISESSAILQNKEESATAKSFPVAVATTVSSEKKSEPPALPDKQTNPATEAFFPTEPAVQEISESPTTLTYVEISTTVKPVPTINIESPTTSSPGKESEKRTSKETQQKSATTVSIADETNKSQTILSIKETLTTARPVPTEVVTTSSSEKELKPPVPTEKPEGLAKGALVVSEAVVQEINGSSAILQNKEFSATAKYFLTKAATTVSSEKKSEPQESTDKQQHPATEALILNESDVQEISESPTALVNVEIPTTVKPVPIADIEPFTTSSLDKEPEIPAPTEKQQKSTTTVSILEETNESQITSAIKEISTTARPVPTEVVTTSSSENELEPTVPTEKPEGLAAESPIASEAVVQEISESSAILQNKETSATAKYFPTRAATTVSSKKKSEPHESTDKQKHPATEALILTESDVQEISESPTTLANVEIPTTAKPVSTADIEPFTARSPGKEEETPATTEKQQKSATTVSIVDETNEFQTTSAIKEISTTAGPVPTEIVTTLSSEDELEPPVSSQKPESLATEAPISTGVVVQEISESSALLQNKESSAAEKSFPIEASATVSSEKKSETQASTDKQKHPATEALIPTEPAVREISDSPTTLANVEIQTTVKPVPPIDTEPHTTWSSNEELEAPGSKEKQQKSATTVSIVEETNESQTTSAIKETLTTARPVPAEVDTTSSSEKELELPVSMEKPEGLAADAPIANKATVQEIGESSGILQNKEASAIEKLFPIEAVTTASSEKKSEQPASTDKHKHRAMDALIPTDSDVQEISESPTTLANEEFQTTVKPVATIDTEPLTTGSPDNEPEAPASRENTKNSAATVSIVEETNESETTSAINEISTTGRPVPTEVVTTSYSEKDLEPPISTEKPEVLATGATIATESVVQAISESTATLENKEASATATSVPIEATTTLFSEKESEPPASTDKQNNPATEALIPTDQAVQEISKSPSTLANEGIQTTIRPFPTTDTKPLTKGSSDNEPDAPGSNEKQEKLATTVSIIEETNESQTTSAIIEISTTARPVPTEVVTIASYEKELETQMPQKNPEIPTSEALMTTAVTVKETGESLTTSTSEEASTTEKPFPAFIENKLETPVLTDEANIPPAEAPNTIVDIVKDIFEYLKKGVFPTTKKLVLSADTETLTMTSKEKPQNPATETMLNTITIVPKIGEPLTISANEDVSITVSPAQEATTSYFEELSVTTKSNDPDKTDSAVMLSKTGKIRKTNIAEAVASRKTTVNDSPDTFSSTVSYREKASTVNVVEALLGATEAPKTENDTIVAEIQCALGYKKDASGTCKDIDECVERSPCEQACRNVPGSYYCSCKFGYVIEPNGTCSDFDECSFYEGICRKKHCVNFVGGYECVDRCQSGFKYSEDDVCIDIDECQDGIHSCHAEHKCLNTNGGHRCVCPRGFKMRDGDRKCIDIDECAMNIRVCAHKCSNTPGSYTCSCNSGFRLGVDGRMCKADVEALMKHRHNGKESVVLKPAPKATCFMFRNMKMCYCPTGYKWNMESMLCESLGRKTTPKSQISTGRSSRKPTRSSSSSRSTTSKVTSVASTTYRRPTSRSRKDTCPSWFSRRCHYQCEGNKKNFRCICPKGYTSYYYGQCRDKNECWNSKKRNKCPGKHNVCFNTRGTYRCVDYTCPTGYKYLDEGYCEKSCTPLVRHGYCRREYIRYYKVSLPRDCPKDIQVVTLRVNSYVARRMSRSQFYFKNGNSHFRLRKYYDSVVLYTRTKLPFPGNEDVDIFADIFDRMNRLVCRTVFKVYVNIGNYPF